ncbi:MAG: MbnP family protein [Salibacteraceae bacterium]
MKLIKISFFGLIVLFTACNSNTGCMDPNAENYDPEAKKYGECTYLIPTDTVTDPSQGVSFELVFNGKAGSQDFYLNTVYKTLSGRNFSATELKYFVSNVKLANNGDDKILIKDVELIDHDTSQSLNPAIPTWDNKANSVAAAIGTFNELIIGYGVDIELNEEFKPNQYDSDHPLNTTYTGMGWGWADKYKFMLFEGNVDSTQDGNVDRAFYYHTGLSDLYRLGVVRFDRAYTFKKGDVVTIYLTLDVPEMIGDLKIETSEEGRSHTNTAVLDSSRNVLTQKEVSAIIQTNLSRNVTFNKIEIN